MKTLIFTSMVIVAVFFATVALGDNLSTSEMDSTWGGGNCKKCPANPNSTCSQSPCSFTTMCRQASGGSFKVCVGASASFSCSNGNVSCGTYSYCADGEGNCDDSTYDCSCHSEQAIYYGCA